MLKIDTSQCIYINITMIEERVKLSFIKIKEPLYLFDGIFNWYETKSN